MACSYAMHGISLLKGTKRTAWRASSSLKYRWTTANLNGIGTKHTERERLGLPKSTGGPNENVSKVLWGGGGQGMNRTKLGKTFHGRGGELTRKKEHAVRPAGDMWFHGPSLRKSFPY